MQDVLHVSHGKVEVVNEAVRGRLIDVLVRDAVHRACAQLRKLVNLGGGAGSRHTPRPASITLLSPRATDKWSGRTVPAMNIAFRVLTRPTQPSAPPADQRRHANLRDCPQRNVLHRADAHGIHHGNYCHGHQEGYTSPLFIQGDHFQVKGAKYKTDPEGAINEVKDLIRQAIPAGFWNIDIDTSTLVTLDLPETLEEQYHDLAAQPN